MPTGVGERVSGGTAPRLSVLIPARNEGDALVHTARSFADGRRGDVDVELCITDDASDDPIVESDFENLGFTRVLIVRNEHRRGVPVSRNRAAQTARGEYLLHTDAHCAVSDGWDVIALRRAAPDVAVAGTLSDGSSAFLGHGCRLIVPFMGTRWVGTRTDHAPFVQIAAASATVVAREAFQRLGGYDENFRIYGAAEPEFSVRMWLAGMMIVSEPGIRIEHEFKNGEARDQIIGERRVDLTHNCLRFGLLYLDSIASLQMLSHFSDIYPQAFEEAMALLDLSEIERRRSRLAETLPRDFRWFVDTFDLKDQVGGDIVFD